MSPKQLLLLICSTFIALQSFSQSGKISGSITDTSSGKKLSMAVVSLIRTKDSTLSKFTRTNEQGSFELSNLTAGSYIFMVSYPGYAEYVDELTITAGSDVQKNITIIPRSKLLEEIIIQQKVAAIRIKGDTTEYKADSFKVGPNASAQELLKRLPGLQVNAKGEITAQGQKVEKILVDGEEFFSDDPAVVAQNLRADVVDKVQVFDKKSEQAEFTGVDDGQKTKTINLELKEDKKKGYFGKIEAGSDFDKYRNGKAMINSFKKKQKIAAYVTHNNTTFEGLNWNEQRNFGSSSNTNMEITDDGGMMMWVGGDDFSSGQGLPTSTTGGISYLNKWNKDKNTFSGSYQFNDQQVKGLNSSFTKTLLDKDSSFSNTTTEFFNSSRRRSKLNANYDWQIDSSATLKFKASGSLVNNSKMSEYTGESYTDDNLPINNTNRTTTTVGENKDFTSELSFRKRLKKAGRTISYTGNFSNNARVGEGFLFSENNFYDKAGQFLRQQDIDQKKTNNENQQTFQNSLVYTEPLSKKWNLELTYRNNFSQNDAKRNTLEKPISNDKYTEIVDTLSNHFLFKTTDHTGGVSFRFAGKKITTSFGTALGRTQFNLDELNKGTNRNIAFINLLPRASFRFAPKKQRSLTLRYNGSTQNPTLQQINPIIDNNDPLNITIGNDKLKQAFRHNFSFSMNDYKIIKSKNLYVDASFSFVNNAISNASAIDSIGRRINQTINVNGNYNGYMWGRYGFEIFKGINFNISTNSNISRFVNRVNNQTNVSDNYSAGFGFGISRWSDKWISFSVNLQPTYNYSKSSINKSREIKYWSMNTYPYVSMRFKKQKLYFDLESNVSLYQKTETFANQRNIFFVTTSLRRTFTKSDAFEAKITVNDLFNQNLGVQRNISSNFISENTFQNIRRFWLLTFTWNFTKNGKPSEF
ncbi:carboxypeptidase family protein [Lacibacter cauensis]|uniref:Carboxypeptidase family protein n=2 Tax=Lacibacter cauensis TaxID=510947 RepID=A0A562SYB7_9BACT|nr:carboxypeptidase family protein [Lacibacter cauensis]